MLVLYPHFSPSHESRNPYSKMGTCFSSQSFWDRPNSERKNTSPIDRLLHWGLHSNRGHGSNSCKVMLKTAPV